MKKPNMKWSIPKYRSPMTKFREKVEAKIKGKIPNFCRDIQESIWDIRFFIVGLGIVSILLDIMIYNTGETTLFNFIVSIVKNLTLMSIPFAYGVDKNKKEVKK